MLSRGNEIMVVITAPVVKVDNLGLEVLNVLEKFQPYVSAKGAWMGLNRIANWRPYLLLNNELELYFLTISE